MNAFEFDPEKNIVATGHKVNVTGHITGSGNRIHIADARNPSNIHIGIHGDNNVIHIADIGRIRELEIAIGSNFPAHNASLEIAGNFSSEENCRFLLYNTGNVCRVGKNCMFSNSITIRCGDMPHLLFDRESGEYLDRSEGVFIGDHVWVGEGVYVTKRASIPDESVVGAMSVVTKRFTQPNVVIAGNPGRVVRENIQWIRNPSLLQPDTKYFDAYHGEP